MITPLEIVNHLVEYLPRVSDLFSDTVGVSSATISNGRTITVNTVAAHGLSSGSPVIITGGQTLINIETVTANTSNTAVITFTDNHDFTGPNGAIESEPLPCVGFNESEWNTTLDIVGVPNTRTVIVNYPTSALGLPTFTTANGYEERPLSIFGTQAVDTATALQFTVELASNVPVLPDGEILGLNVITSARIAAADSIQRANEIYTKVPDDGTLWAFVIMNDVDISKDRHTLNDGFGSFTQQNQMRLRQLINFSVVVFFRSANHISGATAQTLAYGDVYSSLVRSMYGFGGFNSESDGSRFVTVTSGHGIGDSTVAYYTHVYDWQTPVDLTIDNAFDFYEDVALRRMNLALPLFTSDNEERLTGGFNFLPEYVAPPVNLVADWLNFNINGDDPSFDSRGTTIVPIVKLSDRIEFPIAPFGGQNMYYEFDSEIGAVYNIVAEITTGGQSNVGITVTDGITNIGEDIGPDSEYEIAETQPNAGARIEIRFIGRTSQDRESALLNFEIYRVNT